MEYYTFGKFFYLCSIRDLLRHFKQMFSISRFNNVSLNQEQTDTEHVKALNLQVEQLQENEKKMLR